MGPFLPVSWFFVGWLVAEIFPMAFGFYPPGPFTAAVVLLLMNEPVRLESPCLLAWWGDWRIKLALAIREPGP